MMVPTATWEIFIELKIQNFKRPCNSVNVKLWVQSRKRIVADNILTYSSDTVYLVK